LIIYYASMMVIERFTNLIADSTMPRMNIQRKACTKWICPLDIFTYVTCNDASPCTHYVGASSPSQLFPILPNQRMIDIACITRGLTIMNRVESMTATNY
jgi:hypothetical protein